MLLQEHVNLLAVIDSLWLEGSIFNLLKDNFHDKPYYADLLDLFRSVSDKLLVEMHSMVGQA